MDMLITSLKEKTENHFKCFGVFGKTHIFAPAIMKMMAG